MGYLGLERFDKDREAIDEIKSFSVEWSEKFVHALGELYFDDFKEYVPQIVSAFRSLPKATRNYFLMNIYLADENVYNELSCLSLREKLSFYFFKLTNCPMMSYFKHKCDIRTTYVTFGCSLYLFLQLTAATCWDIQYVDNYTFASACFYIFISFITVTILHVLLLYRLNMFNEQMRIYGREIFTILVGELNATNPSNPPEAPLIGFQHGGN